MEPWWGDYEVGVSQTLRWQLGPKTLWITHGDMEWTIASVDGEDPLDNGLIVAEPAEAPTDDEVDVRRFAVRSDSRTAQLEPALPDRPVIVKAARPFFVPESEETTLFVSVPLWIRVYLSGRDKEVLDVAIFRPSDTWFGPDTMTGELCYSSRTSARLHEDNLQLRPHRAITTVRIMNNEASILPLEKLKIPVQNLSLFASEEGHLWTESLTLEREEETDNAAVGLGDRPPQIKGAKQVTPPREEMSKGFLLDAFGGLFVKTRE